MKQTGAWDLTCRPPESHAALPRSPPQPTGLMPRSERAAAAVGLASGCKLNTMTIEPARMQYVMPTSSLSNQTFIWNTLSSNEQLQALLATATRVATLSSASHCNDLVSPLDWLQMPSKTDLNTQLPMQPPQTDYKGATCANGSLLPLTILTSKHSTPEPYGHLAQALGATTPDNNHQLGCLPPPLSSTSPVSTTSSTHSSSSCTTRVTNAANSLTETSPPSNASRSICQSNLDRSSKTVFRSRLASSSSDSELTAIRETNNASVCAMTDLRLDRRARKKDQNRRAAFNYRRKKMEERDRMIEEEARLVHKHVRLAGQIAGLERKIMTILSTKTGRILDKDGQIVYYSCPVCLKFCSKNIQTLRKHLKVQHIQAEMFDCSNIGSQSQNCSPPSPDHGHRGLNDVEYDSCIDSDETNDFDNVDLHKDYGGKFVIGSNLEGDYSTIKKDHSF